MENESQYEKIERYLHQEMEAQEKLDFQEAIKQDDTLAKEVKLHEELMDTLKDEDTHQFRQALKEVDAKWNAPAEKKGGKSVSFNFKRLIQIAAVIGIGIVAFIYLLRPNSISEEELFAQYFTPYQMIMDERSVEVNVEQDLADALSFYKNQDFAKAAIAFENLATKQPNITVFQFYTGISHLANKNPELAIPYFERIIQKEDLLFAQQAKWYMALAHLEDNNKAKEYLKMIKQGAFKYKEAQELLKQL